MYLDNPDNLKVTDENMIKRGRARLYNVVLARVKPDGSFEKAEVLDANAANLMDFYPSCLERIESGAYFLHWQMYAHSNGQVAKIIFNDAPSNGRH